MKKLTLIIILCFILTGCEEMMTQREKHRRESRIEDAKRMKIYSQYNVYGKRHLYFIEKNPQKHYGRLVAFYGQVIQAVETNENTVFQLLTRNYQQCFDGFYDEKTDIYLSGTCSEPLDTSFGPSLLVFFEMINVPIAEDYYIKVLGYIGPPIEGKNAFGMTIEPLMLKAVAVAIPGFTYLLKEDTVYYQEENTELIKQWKSGELIK